MIKVSILIPAYNEEATILDILKAVSVQKIDGIEFEVIVIDDGSKDRTVELLKANPGLYTKLIKQPQNDQRADKPTPLLRFTSKRNRPSHFRSSHLIPLIFSNNCYLLNEQPVFI